MALKKDFKFSNDLIELANYQFAFAHPARILIVQILQATPHAHFERFERAIPLGQATISQHLQILKRVRLIRFAELANGKVAYVLNRESYEYYKSILGNFIQVAA